MYSRPSRRMHGKHERNDLTIFKSLHREAVRRTDLRKKLRIFEEKTK